MFALRFWFEKSKRRIQAIDLPAIGLPKLRGDLKRAGTERAQKEQKSRDIASAQSTWRINPESRAKIVHAEGKIGTLATVLAVLSLFGVAAQTLIYYLYGTFPVLWAVLAGIVTDFLLVGILGGALYFGLSFLYSWWLGYRASLRVAAGVGVLVGAATAVQIYSRVATPHQAAFLLASGLLSYSLLIVAEATPITIAAIASALRYAGDPQRWDRKQAKLQHELQLLKDFIAWGELYETELTAALAETKTPEPPPPTRTDPPAARDDQPGPAQITPASGLSAGSKPNGSAAAAMVALLALGLIGMHGYAHSQDVPTPGNHPKCSIALGGGNALDAAERDEFLRALQQYSPIFNQCKQIRFTAFTDRGRFSPSIVYYPFPEYTLADCSNPAPVMNDNKIAIVYRMFAGFRQNEKDEAVSLCNSRNEQLKQSNEQANQQLQSALEKGLQLGGDATKARCVDTIGALAFLTEEQPDVLLVGSDFSANCPSLSSLWRPIRLQLPLQSRTVFVILPSRGDVRVEGEAAYARASLWKRYNQRVMIRVPSQLTTSFFGSLLRQ
jgi:hypothetical protein